MTEMSYGADLGQGQIVYLHNPGTQTQITLIRTLPRQQQQQSNSFATGAWTVPPSLFRTAAGAIVLIQTAQGQFFILLQSNGMQQLTQPPALTQAEAIPLQQILGTTARLMPETQPMEPIRMQPMQPMQPMKMGDMEMQMDSMQMRMGNMEMRMGSDFSPPVSARQFCTHCGSAVAQQDKFCAHCGHPLQVKSCDRQGLT